MTTTPTATNSSEGLEADQYEKLQYVIELVKSHFTRESIFNPIRKIAIALDEETDELCGTVLPGGYTNYSYKMYLANDPNDTCVFVKLGFAHARWAIDQSQRHDLGRMKSEFELMTRFAASQNLKRTKTGYRCSSNSSSRRVPTPYLLVEAVPEKVTMLVAEWVPTNDQLGNQIINKGNLDESIALECAKFLAMVNTTKFDSSTNRGLVDTFRLMRQDFTGTILSTLDRKPDRTINLARKIGKDRLLQMINVYNSWEESQDCLLHGDPQQFNILVDSNNVQNPSLLAKNIDKEETQDHQEQRVFFVDWEMARPGNKGHDVGVFFAIPFESAVFLAARGQLQQARQLIKSLQAFWATYSQTFKEEGGKTEAEIHDTFKCAMGYFGFWSYQVLYIMELFKPNMVKGSGLSPTDVDRAMSCLGHTSLLCFEVGTMGTTVEDVSSQEVDCETWFFRLLQCELEHAYESIYVQSVRTTLLPVTCRRTSSIALSSNQQQHGIDSAEA